MIIFPHTRQGREALLQLFQPPFTERELAQLQMELLHTEQERIVNNLLKGALDEHSTDDAAELDG